MNRNALALIFVIAVVTILAGTVVITYAAQTQEQRLRGLHRLTEEQRIAIRQKIQEMRKSGASQQEIRAAITAMLREWGISTPAYQRQWLHGLFRRIRQLIRRQ